MCRSWAVHPAGCAPCGSGPDGVDCLAARGSGGGQWLVGTTVMDEEEMAMGEIDSPYVPVTFDRCNHVEGPFYHGTKFTFEVGEELVPGLGSNFQEGRVSNNIYFTALMDTAAWGAELATALVGSGERGHIYIVEPTGPFEDDPNVTNKRFPGNITQSYRSRHPLRVLREVATWEGHAPEVLKGMRDHLALMRERGLDVIED
jgi:hypothetical protein